MNKSVVRKLLNGAVLSEQFFDTFHAASFRNISDMEYLYLKKVREKVNKLIGKKAIVI
jgi:hypothetical protein